MFPGRRFCFESSLICFIICGQLWKPKKKRTTSFARDWIYFNFLFLLCLCVSLRQKKIESAEQHVIAVSKATAASVISEVMLAKDALEKKERDLLTTIHSLTAQRLDYLDNRKRTITIMEQALQIASVNLKTVLENGGNALDMITLQRFAQAQVRFYSLNFIISSFSFPSLLYLLAPRRTILFR